MSVTVTTADGADVPDGTAGEAGRDGEAPHAGGADAAGRHDSVQQVVRWFAYEHLPAGKPRHISALCAAMAGELLRELPDSPELTAGLRKLLEAKDCLVRAAIAGKESQ